MDNPRPVPLSPEQLAAIQDGDGYAHLLDPTTQQVYFLGQPIAPTIDENYVREQLEEAQSAIDRGEVEKWDVDQIKTEVRQRLNRPTN